MGEHFREFRGLFSHIGLLVEQIGLEFQAYRLKLPEYGFDSCQKISSIDTLQSSCISTQIVCCLVVFFVHLRIMFSFQSTVPFLLIEDENSLRIILHIMNT